MVCCLVQWCVVLFNCVVLFGCVFCCLAVCGGGWFFVLFMLMDEGLRGFFCD